MKFRVAKEAQLRVHAGSRGVTFEIEVPPNESEDSLVLCFSKMGSRGLDEITEQLTRCLEQLKIARPKLVLADIAAKRRQTKGVLIK
jgi:hypothetical protein